MKIKRKVTYLILPVMLLLFLSTTVSGDPDYCPDDPQKTNPGICGCGTPDTDSNNDGIPDCRDELLNQIKSYLNPWIEAISPQPEFNAERIAKAESDACFYGINAPEKKNIYDPNQEADCTHNKVNQAYVWGLTKAGDHLWFGTTANTHCMVLGRFLSYTEPVQTDSWVCEYGASQFGSQVGATIPPAIGDWRPPRIFKYDTTGKAPENPIDITPVPTSEAPWIVTTVGIRSAGSTGNTVILGGPDMRGGINLFAFDATTGAYLGADHLTEYNNIRKWRLINGILYTAVRTSEGEGRILRWKGIINGNFSFEEVGNLRSEGAELAEHDGRLFVTTWPKISTDLSTSNSTDLPISAGLYMSPPIPSGGLTASHATIGDAGYWTKVWDVTTYEPDIVTSLSYGGGALASFDGYLYWGTMHVPMVATVAHMKFYELTKAADILLAFFGTHRSISIFRGSNFAENPDIELLYGNTYMPAYHPFNGWEIVPNKMGTARYGPSGFGNPFNAYTWTMAVYDDQLFVGTMDWSYLMVDVLASLFGEYLDTIPEQLIGTLRLFIREYSDTIPGQLETILNMFPLEQQTNPAEQLTNAINRFTGADLFRFPSKDARAVAENISGIGNNTNYGIRTMIADQASGDAGDALYLGMANPMNLMPEGGWELIKLVASLTDPPPEDDPGNKVEPVEPTGGGSGGGCFIGNLIHDE